MGDADVCVCFRVFIESINEESRSRAAVRLQSHKKMSETCDSRDTNHRPPLPKPTVDDHFIPPRSAFPKVTFRTSAAVVPLSPVGSRTHSGSVSRLSGSPQVCVAGGRKKGRNAANERRGGEEEDGVTPGSFAGVKPLRGCVS